MDLIDNVNETPDTLNTTEATEPNASAQAPTTERIAGKGAPSLAQGEGFFSNAIIAIGLFAIPLLLLVVYYKLMFVGLTNNNAMDFAQLGKNLSDGKGFTTYYLRPLGLTHGDNILNQPDVINSPLYPFILGLAFGARGATDATAAQISGLFYLLTVPVLYFLACRLFSRKVALIAVAIYAANPLMLEYATSGLPITLQTFLTTSLLLLFHTLSSQLQARAENPQRPLPHAALVGIGAVTAALYLTDSVLLPLIPVVVLSVVGLLRANNALRAVGAFLLPLALMVLPWMFRLGRLTGNPFYGLRGMELWMGTKNFYPGGLAYRTMPEDLVPSMGLFQAVVRKVTLGIGEVIQAFPQVSASWMLAFLLPSLLFRFRDTIANNVRSLMMYCFLGTLIGMLPFGVEMPLFAPLVPAMLVFAVAYLLRLLDQANPPRATRILLTSLLVVSVALPLVRMTVLMDRPEPPTGMRTAQALKKIMNNKEAVLTDQPWLIAWYTNRPAIWIPNTNANITKYRERFKGLRWMFLTDQVTSFSDEWQAMYGVLYQWNVKILREQQAAITNNDKDYTVSPATILADDNMPLSKYVDGFVTVEPYENNPRANHVSKIAVAALPVEN